MPDKLTADEYINDHWFKNEIWTHLQAPKHQKRLSTCASLCLGVKLADIGCACGHSTSIMRGFIGGEWLGIDFSVKAIQRARELFTDIRFEYVPEISGLYNLKRFNLDSIVCSEVMEHVEDDKGLFSQLVNIAKERVIMTTPCCFVSDPGHLRIYNEEMIHELCGDYKHMITKDEKFWYIVIDTNGITE